MTPVEPVFRVDYSTSTGLALHCAECGYACEYPNESGKPGASAYLHEISEDAMSHALEHSP